jgi:hypothetical protein
MATNLAANGTVIDGQKTDVPKKIGWRFPKGHNLGHRFEKGHPFYPPKYSSTEHERLKNKFIRALKKEYGPDLTVPQLEAIENAADMKARLRLLGEKADPLTAAKLIKTMRHELDALNE